MRKIIKFLSACALAFAAQTFASLQAQDIPNMGTLELRNNANILIDQREYVQARPYMETLIERMEMTDPSQLESMYFFMGFSYVQEYASIEVKNMGLLEQAIPYFDKVIVGWPGGKLAGQSIELKANCLNALGKPEEAADVWALKLQSPYVEMMNFNERAALVRKICQAFYVKNNWEKGRHWFEQLYMAARNLEDKTYAAVALIRTHLAEYNFEEARKYYPMLTNSVPSRYDIYLSTDFLVAGDSLVGRGEYAEASLCYTFVLTKEEISDYMAGYAKRLEKQIAQISASSKTDPRLQDLEAKFNYANKMVAALENVPSYTSQLLARMARNYFSTKRDYESFWAYRQLLDDYPEDSMAEKNCFAAFVCAIRLGKEKQIDALANEYRTKYPEGEFIKELNIQFALYLIKTGQLDRFYMVADEALAAAPDDDISQQYVFLIGKNMIEQKDYATLRAKLKSFGDKNPKSPAMSGVLYWSMMSYLIEMDYENAYPFAERLVTEFPGSIYDADANYRLAVCVFGKGLVSDAKKYFENFIEKFSLTGGDLIGEAELFLGDIYYIEQAYEDSYTHYMKVPAATQKKSLIDSAFLHCAGMLEAAEMYDRQAATIMRYIKDYPDADAAMAAFMLTTPLFKQGLSSDAVRGYMNAIAKYGSDPKNDSVDKIIGNYAKFYDEAKTQMNATADFLQKAVDDKAFLEMLVNNPADRYEYTMANPDVNPLVYAKFKIQQGMDRAEFGPEVLANKKPIESLLKLYRDQQSKFPKESPERFFENTMKGAKAKGEILLERRMQMALDEIGKLKEKPNMFAEDDFKGMSYKVLVWMAKFNERYDVESSRRALDEVINSPSDYKLDALFALAEIEERSHNYQGAIDTYKRAEDDFPTDALAFRAAIRQAELYVKIGKLDEAVSKLTALRGAAMSGGEIQAEILYRLGIIEKDRGNKAMAIMYFDNCALSYADILEYSAKSVFEGAKLCIMEGKKEQALEFCKTFLDDPNSKSAREYGDIESYYRSIR